jgi:VCBS repeat-containing protein
MASAFGGFKVGREFLVNSYTASVQQSPDVAPLASGGFVAVFQSSYSQAIGQRFTAAGEKIGPEFIIGSSREVPQVAPLAGGGFIVVWVRGDDYAVVAQRYSDTGAKVGAPIIAAAAPPEEIYRMIPAIATLASGEVVIGWSETDGNGSYDVYLQRLGTAFEALGEPLLVNSIMQGSQYAPGIAALEGGGFAVQWRDNGSSDTGFLGDVDIQIFDASGTPVGWQFGADIDTSGDQSPGHIAPLPSGGFISVWPRSNRNGFDTEYSIEAQIFDAAGNRVGTEILVSPAAAGAKITPTVLPLSGGFFLIVWADGSAAAGDGSGYGLKAQMFDAVGVKVGTEFLVNEITQGYQYRPSATMLASGGFVISWSDTSGLGGDTSESVKARIFEPNAVARADAVATDESRVLSGSLFADNGSGADGGTPAIAGINGLSASIGKTITLASGALLTVQADGSFVYDPNGKHTALAAFGSGAVNTSATESFTYTLSSGNTATVTLTVRGVASAGDMMRGDGGDNEVTGTGGADLMLLDQGGTDRAFGGGGNDRFFLGGAFNAADRIEGGEGEDSLILSGILNVTLDAETISGIERLRLLSGGGGGEPNRFHLTTHDANVAAGGRLLVDAQDLLAGETLIFNGSAEKDGRFQLYGGAGADILAGGAGKDELFGSGGADRLYGMAGDDVISGGAGADWLNGGLGADRFLYASASESTGSGFDTIEGFDPRADRIDLPGALTGWNGVLQTGFLSAASFDSDLAAAVDDRLDPGGAMLFRPDAGTFAGRTFLLADADGDGAYVAGADFLIEIGAPILPGAWGTGIFV